jgi:acetyl esterase/lipase
MTHYFSGALALVGFSLASAAFGAAEPRPPEITPATLPGAETHIFRELSPDPVRLHVFKPMDWKAADHRPALIWFFGGGWTTGTPTNAAYWAKWATDHGMVGVAPDYRTKGRFNSSPLESVADSRAALQWIEAHAAELGIDPHRIVVGGNSSGGHVALWTAITHSPPGSAEAEAPPFKPAALILTSAVSDTSKLKGYTPVRFGDNADALSPVQQLDAKMPPMLVFHGDADKTVPQSQSLALRDALLASGNVCEFVNVPGGSHNFGGELPEWREKTRTLVGDFLTKQKILPVVAK